MKDSVEFAKRVDSLKTIQSTAGGSLGDYTPDGQLWIFGIDSKTEQALNANNSGSAQLANYMKTGGKLEKLAGIINFGGSGYSMDAWLNDPQGTIPTISTSNLSVGNWDYFGHKPTGAIPLATALAWRSGKADKATWFIDGGTNDLILYAANGNMTLQQITDYISSRLIKAIQRIQAAYPLDKIVLRVPSPMTARPYSTGLGFPSATAYPTFGNDLATDSTLVDKWNNGLRNGYYAARNRLPGVVLFDSWNLVFEGSNAGLTAGTQIPFKTDLVHETNIGYAAEMRALVNYLLPNYSTHNSAARRDEADLRATALGNNPWDNYPGYFRNNARFKKVADNITVSGIGINFVDLNISKVKFNEQTNNSAPIYIVIGDKAAQYFAGYFASISGSITRLTSVTPTALMQTAASGEPVEIYQDNLYGYIAGDSYVDSVITTKSPKEYYTAKISTAGNGFFDINIDAKQNRISTAWLTGLKNSRLAVGGTVKAIVDLTTGTTFSQTGTYAGRGLRVFKSGDWSLYANSSSAFYFSDSVVSPKVYEAGGLYGMNPVSHITATDANVTLANTTTWETLPVITANRTLTVSNGTFDQQPLLIWNKNSNASFSWAISGTLADATGTAITTLTNGTFYRFLWDSAISAWVRTN